MRMKHLCSGKTQPASSFLPHSFKSFQAEIIRQNKPNSSSFVKAKLSCVEQFRYTDANYPSPRW